jgi:cytochrome P450
VAAIGGYVDTARRFLIGQFRALIRLPLAWPLPSHRAFRGAIIGLGRLIEALIAQRRAATDDGDDLLGRLLRASDDPASPPGPKELRDQAINILIAGSETSAATLTWVWTLLSRHPAVEEGVAAELRAVLDGRSPTAADGPRLPYLRAVIRETLRLYPPVWLFLRKSTAPFSLGRCAFPANTQIMISPWLLHRSPRQFANADTFCPARWASGDPPPALMPFGGGPRQCIGQHFALMEALMVIATIRAQARLALVSDAPVQPEPLVTLRPRGRVLARIESAATDPIPQVLRRPLPG